MASLLFAVRTVFYLHSLGLSGSRLKQGDKMTCSVVQEPAHLYGAGHAFSCFYAGEHAIAELAHKGRLVVGFSRAYCLR